MFPGWNKIKRVAVSESSPRGISFSGIPDVGGFFVFQSAVSILITGLVTFFSF